MTEEIQDDNEITEISLDDAVWHIKLMNGEDVMGRIQDDPERNIVKIMEPMVMQEIGSSSGYSMMGMIRYIDQTLCSFVPVSRDAIITMVPTTPALADFYDKKVEYCHKVTDVRLRKATELATGEIEHMLRSTTQPDDYIQPAISENEFKAMPVWGTA